MLERIINKFLQILLSVNGNQSSIGTQNENNRHEWLKKKLNNLPARSKIIDAGAGECQYKAFCSHLEYVSQDFNQYHGKIAADGQLIQKWDTSDIDIVSDITNIPVEDKSFDVVMCTEVLEHVPDPVAALKELDRILKPNGHIILTSPFASLTHFQPYHFSSGFNKYFYKYWLEEKFGYDILELEANGNYYEFLAQEVRRLESIEKKYSKNAYTSPLKYRAREMVLNWLHAINHKNNQSDELLAFGFHVLAKKKG